jgi:hypothetical protein
MESPYAKYKCTAIEKMSVAQRTKALEETCLDALSCGWHPERMTELIDGSIDNEEYELVQAIIGATEKFSKNPQLALFKFNVPEQVKEPRPDVDPLAFLHEGYEDED